MSRSIKKLAPMPGAKQVAMHLQTATSLYGITATHEEELIELRTQLEAEKEKKKVARSMVEQLQVALNARDAHIRSLTAQLSTMEESLSAASATAAQAKAQAAAAEAATSIAKGEAASSLAAAAYASSQKASPGFIVPSARGGEEAQTTREYDPSVSLSRQKGLEAENTQLRSVALTLQSQRDAFESVAHQLQTHSQAVESAFGALQQEAQSVWDHCLQQEDLMRKAKTTQTGYENGLAQLLLLLGRQQEKIKRHIRESDGILNELTPAVRTLGEVASHSGEHNKELAMPRARFIFTSLPALIDSQQQQNEFPTSKTVKHTVQNHRQVQPSQASSHSPNPHSASASGESGEGTVHSSLHHPKQPFFNAVGSAGVHRTEGVVASPRRLPPISTNSPSSFLMPTIGKISTIGSEISIPPGPAGGLNVSGKPIVQRTLSKVGSGAGISPSTSLSMLNFGTAAGASLPLASAESSAAPIEHSQGGEEDGVVLEAPAPSPALSISNLPPALFSEAISEVIVSDEAAPPGDANTVSVNLDPTDAEVGVGGPVRETSASDEYDSLEGVPFSPITQRK